MSIERRTALIAALALPAATLLPGRASSASETDTLERLLAFEHGLEQAYAEAARRGLLRAGLAALLRNHERDHAQGLERALSGRGERGPIARVPAAALERALGGGSDAFARHALRLESDAIDAYISAVPTLADPELRRALGSVAASGGQHRVLLRRELGRDPLPRP